METKYFQNLTNLITERRCTIETGATNFKWKPHSTKPKQNYVTSDTSGDCETDNGNIRDSFPITIEMNWNSCS